MKMVIIERIEKSRIKIKKNDKVWKSNSFNWGVIGEKNMN